MVDQNFYLQGEISYVLTIREVFLPFLPVDKSLAHNLKYVEDVCGGKTPTN